MAHAQVAAQGSLVGVLDADPRDPVHFRRPGHRQALAVFGGAVLGYARRPLVASNAATGEEVALIDDAFSLDLNGGIALSSWAQLDLTVPLYGFRGNSIDAGFDQPVADSGLGLADVRVAGLFTLFAPDPDEKGVGIGVVGHADLPTGQLHDTYGRRGPAGGLGVVGTGTADAFTVSGQVGLQVDPTREEGVPGGPSLRFAADVSRLLDDELGVGVELNGAMPLHSGGSGVPLEAIARVRHGLADGPHFLGGIGMGLSGGVGTPSFRAFVGGGFGTTGRPADRDGDGLVDAFDDCPQQAETMNGLDDEDGCPDRRSRLAITAGVDGVALPDAQVALDGPMERSFTTTSAPEAFEVDPGSVWKANASLGACLKGEALATVGDEDVDLMVPLERIDFAEVNIFVYRSNGSPASGALLEFTSDDPFCVPPEFVEVSSDGKATVTVGPGRHRVEAKEGDRAVDNVFTPVEGTASQVYLVLQ